MVSTKWDRDRVREIEVAVGVDRCGYTDWRNEEWGIGRRRYCDPLFYLAQHTLSLTFSPSLENSHTLSISPSASLSHVWPLSLCFANYHMPSFRSCCLILNDSIYTFNSISCAYYIDNFVFFFLFFVHVLAVVAINSALALRLSHQYSN